MSVAVREKPKKAKAEKADKVLLGAVDLAKTALLDITPADTIGEHQGAEMIGERLAMHHFAYTAKGYVGWHWTVSVARAPRQKFATVCEVNLLPGGGAILTPDWVPYAERVRPGDIGAGDVTPYVEDDPNLEFGFEASGDEEVDEMAFFELGLGRPRVLSREGREAAAQRWYDGSHGPRNAVAVEAPAHCTTCGYFLPMPGALRPVFGVCANEWSPSDGSVVSLDHGCGAHSEVDVVAREPEHVEPPRLDDFEIEVETMTTESVQA